VGHGPGVLTADAARARRGHARPAVRENTLKQRLQAGQPAFGVMCTFPSSPVLGMLGHLGFDWIPFDSPCVACLRVARAS